jgi:DNA polymerase (family 10)
MHTTWSDGAESAEAMAAAAKGLGYEYICVTDHSQSLKVAGGVSVADLRRHVAHVRALSDRAGLTVLIGTECDIGAGGSLDYPDEILAELDVVIASAHTRFRMTRDEMTRRMVRAMESEHVDILGHPTGRLLGARDPYEVDVEAIVDAAVRTGTTLEINAAPERLDLKDTHVRLATERGARLEIGTDAHSTAQLRNMGLGVSTARRGWVEAAGVINTLPLAGLRDVLGRRTGSARRRR